MMATDHGVTAPINIGNPHDITVAELAARIQALIDGTQPVEYLPLPTDDPQQRQPDITRARETLGWEPAVELGEGLPRTVAWFAQTYGQAAAEHTLAAFTPELDLTGRGVSA